MPKTVKQVNPKAAVLKVLKGERKRLQGLLKGLGAQADEKEEAAEAVCENTKENADLDFEAAQAEIEAWLEEQTEDLERQVTALDDLLEAY